MCLTWPESPAPGTDRGPPIRPVLGPARCGTMVRAHRRAPRRKGIRRADFGPACARAREVLSLGLAPLATVARMSPDDPLGRRRALALLLAGLGLAAVLLAPTRARADDDEDHSGPGGGGDDHDDDDDDDDDHSGPGGGGDDDRDEDHSGSGRNGDDDRSGPGSGWDDGDNGSSHGSPGDGQRPRDIAVYYPDGWIERIVAGRYELIDHQRRLVVARTATSEDFARMIALR